MTIRVLCPCGHERDVYHTRVSLVRFCRECLRKRRSARATEWNRAHKDDP